MTDIRKKILKKINQGGSMMVEAMAMLALIALVTPTLYKKSAERTTELQDINTASHIRTLSKAVDNYVGTNYQALLDPQKGVLKTDGSSANITLATLAPYLPYGYSFDELKNFGTPTVSVRRTADSVTAFVNLPRKTDIGQMRAARIASMVGSNGGYVNTDGEAKGVGGVWSLDTSGLNHLGFSDSQPGSIIVASSEAINSATSGALENEKYLQRTPVPEGEEWRNTMITDLYMGGHGTGETSDMHQILGVEKMIIGATENPEGVNANGLVIAGDRSAWIGGGLSVLDESFLIKKGMNSTAQLDFFGTDRKLIHASEMFANSPLVQFIIKDDGSTPAVKFTDTDATVNADTHVATGTNDIFTVGAERNSPAAQATEVIYADKDKVELHKGELKVSTDANNNKYTAAKTKLYVGMDAPATSEPTPTFLISDRKLDVNGNAYVKDTLQANDVKSVNHVVSGTSSINKLRAGELDILPPNERNTNKDKDDNYWLTVGSGPDGIKARDYTGDERMLIDMDYTKLKGIANNSDLQSGLTLDVADATLEGIEKTYLRTLNTDGIVSIQDGAIVAAGNYTDVSPVNTVDVNAETATVNANTFNVTSNSTALVQVGRNVVTDGNSNVKIDEDGMLLSNYDSNNLNKVLEVDYSSFAGENKTNGTQNYNKKGGSVYIRRGAIELEAAADLGTDANDGVGYIEASRFVSNAPEADHGSYSGVATPTYSLDYNKQDYYGASVRADSEGKASGTGYDRYMVNPAYTSVMHDIKLTSRGGARLSDILPDFINKGIYVLTNTYEDSVAFENIEAEIVVEGDIRQVRPKGLNEIQTDQILIGEDRWASPFMGIVPAPQCPPGHAKLITLTPSGFQMAQVTSRFIGNNARNPFTGGGVETRPVLPIGNDNAVTVLGDVNEWDYWQTNPGDRVIETPGIIEDEKNVPSGTNNKYYLGYTGATSSSKPTTRDVSPLYFQQSTWLRSMVQPQQKGEAGDCSLLKGGCDGNKFLGWSAIMGFIYPGTHYEQIILRLHNDDSTNLSSDAKERVYWNIFPVQTATMEAYATVYCYFDRTNIFDSGIDGRYVDQYDQLNQFREGYKKWGNTVNDGEVSTNQDWNERIDDPSMKYQDPW